MVFDHADVKRLRTAALGCFIGKKTYYRYETGLRTFETKRYFEFAITILQ